MSNRRKPRYGGGRPGWMPGDRQLVDAENIEQLLEEGMPCPYCDARVWPADDTVWRCDCGWSGLSLGDDEKLIEWVSFQRHVEGHDCHSNDMVTHRTSKVRVTEGGAF